MGKGVILQTVTGAVQTDHEAITDEDVVADAFERDDILDPRRIRPVRRCGDQHQRNECDT